MEYCGSATLKDVFQMERKNNMEQWEIEEIILGMADIVKENRLLREENERLSKVEEEYRQSIYERERQSEQASRNMLNAALVGITMEKNEKELIKELVDYL